MLTGINTVLCDDPLLTVRLTRPRRQPLRAVLDPGLRLPLQSQIALTARDYPTWLFCSAASGQSPQAAALADLGIAVHPVEADAGRLHLAEVLAVLHRQSFYSVMLECGSELASAFMAQGLVDKCLLFLCPKFIGGGNAILAELNLPDLDCAIELQNLKVSRSGEDILVMGYPVFR